MRFAFVIGLLMIAACSRQGGRKLDALLTGNRIDRIDIVDDEHGSTNVLTGSAVARLLERLAVTNRSDESLPIGLKNYASGFIILRTRGRHIGSLAYLPREQLLSYHNYEFSFRDTNDIAKLFR